MPKDILLYGRISQYNAMFFHDQIAEATEEEAEADMNLRINCEGGDPDYGMGVITKFQEMAAQFSITCETMIHSMALFLLCYVDTAKVKAIDTANAVLHRAAYPDWVEQSTWFAGSIQEALMKKSNKDLEKAFRASVDVKKLEALPQFTEKNITLKNIFSTDGREEVLLSAADLKTIGLVGKIVKITPTKKATIDAMAESFKTCSTPDDFKLAAQATPKPPKVEAGKEEEELKNENTRMTLAELKEKHAAVYAEAVADGVAKEKDRVEAALVYVDVDPAGVKKIIETGAVMTGKQMAEFGRKMMSTATLEKIEDSSADALTTEEPKGAQTEKAKKLAAFEAGVDSSLKLEKK